MGTGLHCWHLPGQMARACRSWQGKSHPPLLPQLRLSTPSKIVSYNIAGAKNKIKNVLSDANSYGVDAILLQEARGSFLR
eukprot:scaffold2157_cov133-Isochrysis_galbana.AAC.3